MKTLKYLIAALAVAFALAGCAGGSGSANFDATSTSSDSFIMDLHSDTSGGEM